MKNSTYRQIVVGGLSLILAYLFFQSRGLWDPMHAWNRAFADVSLLFLSVILLLGSLSKVFKSVRKWLVWRRELGIWTGVTAIVHVLIILDGWVQWELFQFFFVFSPIAGEWVLHPGFALGNLLGIVALVYVLILMLTSNTRSKKILGFKSWKYVQQTVHVLYHLVILHTAYFIFIHNPDAPNWLQVPFIMTITLVWLSSLIGFWFTVKEAKKSKGI
ncbi:MULTISPECIES: ferric reductase-like transmembrane domain-containing protein [Bacillaceae]|uniref:Ferric reductase-like transmembrane domain-containing protein n=1 Tax=Halalkalibacter alkaliphilus TaxID=2917993 RepID=A0A9X2A6T0_9BACI|nr:MULTISPECIES: ferric reductase-like transmembrane domain-containing protein [Bacillaceae]MCL7746671.1 ferric reductase-like transmembrane domain-containing protein [Halalkalibacter alkaliphilus]MDT8860503.1 ferric reductase-like transmembrane domain-containing protein [Alkalihalobacillus sp. MEB130]